MGFKFNFLVIAKKRRRRQQKGKMFRRNKLLGKRKVTFVRGKSFEAIHKLKTVLTIVTNALIAAILCLYILHII